MSTHKTSKGNIVEINWRNHNSEGKKDIDYLLDQVDNFVDATRAYKPEIDNIAIVHHVTKNKPKVVKVNIPVKPPTIVKKKVVKKAVKKVTKKTPVKKKIAKKTASKKKAKKKAKKK